MNYGVFHEFYSEAWTPRGNRSATGMIGTTSPDVGPADGKAQLSAALY